MQENWEDIPDFPDYAVSDQGRVMNTHLNKVLRLGINRQGVQQVSMREGGKAYTRSVAKLVTDAFLPTLYMGTVAFDTPINLNGERTDNRLSNLMLRPRTVAIEFHKQFYWVQFHQNNHTCIELETGIIFDQPKDACIKYGLRYHDVIKSIIEEVPCFPDNQNFRDIRDYT